MKRLFLHEWKWWKKHNIREQIFIAMLFLTIFATGVLGSVSYYMTTNAIEKNYRQSYETTLKNSSKVLDLRLEPIVENTRAVLHNEELKRMLSGTLQYNGNTFELQDQKVLEDILETISFQAEGVNGIALMDFYGHVFYLSNINKGMYQFYAYYKEHDFKEEAWYEAAREAKGREVFFGSNVLGGTDEEGEFSFAKILNNPNNGQPMGCMVVNLSGRMLEKSFIQDGEDYQTSAYMIVDGPKDNTLVYLDGENEHEAEIMEAFTGNREASRYIFSEAKNSTTGWTFLNIIEKNELSVTSKFLRNLVFLLMGIVGVFGFFIARHISGRITRPLKQLERTIYDVGEGARNISEEFDDSEVGRIGKKFKEMVNTNLELSERLMAMKLNEREAEILLLQSQINPHFLYNTLDSIYCVAMIHGDDQIGEMILALSNNFKLSLNNGERFVTVENDMKRIEEYMKLQNMRYNNRFELHIEVEPDVLPCKIISFILQPFVENAMYHGLEPKMGTGGIWIRGRKENKNLILEISDDGVGIKDIKTVESGYGIRNVKERILLNYGEAYGVSFESEEGKGTTVRIKVPEEPGGAEVCID